MALIGGVLNEFLLADLIFYGYAQEILVRLNSTLIVFFLSNTLKNVRPVLSPSELLLHI